MFFFGSRFLGLQIFFIFGGFVCFFLSFMVLKRQIQRRNRMRNEHNQKKDLERCQTVLKNSMDTAIIKDP